MAWEAGWRRKPGTAPSPEQELDTVPMTFEWYTDARQFLLSELCYLAAESIHQQIGVDALVAAGKLHEKDSPSPYLEYSVGDYTYYVEHKTTPHG